MIANFKEFSPKIGAGVFIAPNASVIGRCTIGDDSSIWFGVVVRADVNEVKIGKCTSIQDNSIIHVDHYRQDKSGHPTIIGNNCTIGHMVMVHACEIGDDCLIGSGAKILDGAKIGEQSIVGAGSLVTKNKIFEPRSLIMGSPAKFIRHLSDKEIMANKTSAARYVKFKNDYLDPTPPYVMPEF